MGDRVATVRLGVVASVAAMAVLVAAALPSTGRAQTATAAVPEGEWTGWLTFIATGVASGGGGAGSGTFTMTSAGGVLEGDATWVFGPANVTAIVQGDAAAPQLQVQSILVNGSPSPVSPSDPPIQLTISTASCEMVTGSGSGVGNIVASGSWTAVRAGALTGDPAAFRRELTELTERIESIKADLLAGLPVDRWDLLVAAFAAQGVSQGLSRSPACGGPGAAHSSVAAGLIAELLATTIENGDAIDTQTFADLVRAAVGSGSIGAGATGQAAEDLEFEVFNEIQFRIDEAIAFDDPDSLRILAVLSHQMGYASLEQAALAGLEEIGT